MIPYIECNDRFWAYIKPYLIKWEYNISDIDKWRNFPYLIIDRNNILGEVTNTDRSGESYTRTLVKDIDEFLTRAAELMGYTYTDSYKDGVVKLTIEQIEDILDIPRGLLIIDE